MAKQILTADDSVSIRQMVSFTLKQAGFDVLEAVDGKDAISKIENGAEVHMLITDLNMPHVDGIELIKHVRGKAQCKFIPIIMLTTESAEEKKMAGKAAGATGWIVKPFTPEQLVAVVMKVLH